MGKISQRTHKQERQDRGTGTGDSEEPTESLTTLQSLLRESHLVSSSSSEKDSGLDDGQLRLFPSICQYSTTSE